MNNERKGILVAINQLPNGEILQFTMEPEEELRALRFIAKNKNSVEDWKKLRPDDCFTATEQAEYLNLTGGYKLNFFDQRGGGFD